MSNKEYFNPNVVRKGELNKLHQVVQKNSNVIVRGERGIGKSKLVRDYVEEYGNFYDQLYLFMSFDVDTLQDLRDQSWERDNKMLSLVIFDGFDEVFLKEDKERVYKVFKEYRKYGIKAILVSNDTPALKPFLDYAVLFELQGFTQDEKDELVSQAARHYNLNVEEKTKLQNLVFFQHIAFCH